MLGTRGKLESVEVGVGNFDVLGLATTIWAHGYETAALVKGSQSIKYWFYFNGDTDRHSHKHRQQTRG